MEGIPSFGGPPPLILSSEIICLTPFVSSIVSSALSKLIELD